MQSHGITNKNKPMINNINITILEWMIAEREMLLKLQEKERAVRSQDFNKAVILLEEQRAIEKRLPTFEQLQELKTYYQQNQTNAPTENNAG